MATREAHRGDIFCRPDDVIVRVTRVGRTGAVTIQAVGGALDGHTERLPQGIPADWSQYPS